MAAVTFSGANGIDWNSILNAVIAQESQPLTNLQGQQTDTKNKDAAFASLAGIITNLQTPTTALTSLNAFSGLAGTSTDSSVANVTMGDGGIAGEYAVSITDLAKGQTTSSSTGYAAATDIVADSGSISFTIGGQTTQAITVGAGTTLTQLKEKINTQNSGVAASVVNDGTGYKLILSSRQTGLSNGFTINNSLATDPATNPAGRALAFAVGQSPASGNAQDAQDAAFTVNGLSITSASNTITDAIPGVTLSLRKAGDVKVNVSSDYSSLKDNIKTLVTQYNTLRKFYNQQQQSTGALHGDPVLRQAMTQTKNALLARNDNGGRYHYLAEIGLEVTATGDLKLDESKLNTAIDSNPADLQALFQGTVSVGGALDSVKDALASVDGTAGLIKSSRKIIDTTLKGLQNRIDDQKSRLTQKRQSLLKLYAATDAAMSSLSSATTTLQNLSKQTF
ncbi:MAG TPA: flagellar filament capping protein FliD [Terriglobia bacterium]|nr:flagellar filament capping protein FliD [Terriglobia bacterium]